MIFVVNSDFKKEMIEDCFQNIINHFNLQFEQVEIDVELEELGNVQGFTHESDDNTFQISINPKFLKTELFKTIISHELVHVAQLIQSGKTSEPEAYELEEQFARML